MPTYIMLTTLNPDGVQTIKNNPSRIKEVNKRDRAARRRPSMAQWATLGQFDFINVVEAPDEADDRARLARARLSRHGQVRDADRDPDRRLHQLDLSCSRRVRSTPAVREPVSAAVPARVLVLGAGAREHALVQCAAALAVRARGAVRAG